MKTIVGTLRIIDTDDYHFGIVESFDGAEYSINTNINIDKFDDDEMVVAVVKDRKRYSAGYTLPIAMKTPTGNEIAEGETLEKDTILLHKPRVAALQVANALDVEIHQEKIKLLQAQSSAALASAGL